jgi:hypothetical protein
MLIMPKAAEVCSRKIGSDERRVPIAPCGGFFGLTRRASKYEFDRSPAFGSDKDFDSLKSKCWGNNPSPTVATEGGRANREV